MKLGSSVSRRRTRLDCLAESGLCTLEFTRDDKGASERDKEILASWSLLREQRHRPSQETRGGRRISAPERPSTGGREPLAGACRQPAPGLVDGPELKAKMKGLL